MTAPVVTGSASRPRSSCEAYVPAQYPASGPQARFPAPYVRPCRPVHPQGSPSARPSASVCLIDPVTDRAVFRDLRTSRQRGSSGPVAVICLPRPGAARPGVAFALPRRLGGAVVRNRCRRRLRSICVDLTKSGELPVMNYLFTVRNDMERLNHTTLRQHVVRAVERAVR